MKVTYVTFEGTPAELAETSLAGLLRTLLAESTADGSGAPVARVQQAAPNDLDAAVPGVPPEGQLAVQHQLRRNPAPAEFRAFLAEVSTWRDVRVHGKKRRGTTADGPRDFTDYLRIRRTGSPVGGFAYVRPESGIVLLRLPALDARSRAVAPDAVETSAGHRQYRVKITISDSGTLGQALALASLAYKASQ